MRDMPINGTTDSDFSFVARSIPHSTGTTMRAPTFATNLNADLSLYHVYKPREAPVSGPAPQPGGSIRFAPSTVISTRSLCDAGRLTSGHRFVLRDLPGRSKQAGLGRTLLLANFQLHQSVSCTVSQTRRDMCSHACVLHESRNQSYLSLPHDGMGILR